MLNLLGRSVYLTDFERQKESLTAITARDTMVFISLHISEEFCEEFCQKAQAMCDWLHERGFQIIADVSKKTLRQFDCDSLYTLAGKLNITALRIDYGFTVGEICSLAKKMPVVVNASTTSTEDAATIAAAGSSSIAMHNFYPRPETGIDEDFLLERTRELQKAGLKVFSFIAGDTKLRGPLCCGLPTLEIHRSVAPSAAFVDSIVRLGLDGVFLGDPDISYYENGIINTILEMDVILLPVYLQEKHRHLYGAIFTNRPDSPDRLIRFMESREYSCCGEKIEADDCSERATGSITMDNENYGRYSGEIQIALKDYCADSRVNVIGHICSKHILLARQIKRGKRFCLIPLNENLTEIEFNKLVQRIKES